MKILIAGDYCQRYRVDTLVKDKCFGELFDQVKPIIESADYSIVNFEFPIVLNKETAKPIPKCGPNLEGTIESVDAIKYAGFKCCTLANNHILDQGEQCCLDTKNELEKVGIDTVGVGGNLGEASKCLYKKINGETLAIINCCEHEFSIATESEAGANPLNPIRQYYAIQEAKKQADYVLVIVHGGHEHFQFPSPRMQETYRFFVDAGADAVVNHHQHCYSGYEVYNSKPIFYGLGNFLFDRPGKVTSWNDGYLVVLDTLDSSFKVIPYKHCVDSPSVRILHNTIEFEKQLSELNLIINNQRYLSSVFDEFVRKRKKAYRAKLSPYSNIYVRELAVRGFIPSFVNDKKILEMINSVECEAHRDCLIKALK